MKIFKKNHAKGINIAFFPDEIFKIFYYQFGCSYFIHKSYINSFRSEEKKTYYFSLYKKRKTKSDSFKDCKMGHISA